MHGQNQQISLFYCVQPAKIKYFCTKPLKKFNCCSKIKIWKRETPKNVNGHVYILKIIDCKRVAVLELSPSREGHSK